MSWASIVYKLGVGTGAVLGVAGALQSVPGLPPKWQGIVGSIAAVAGIVAGVAHPSPITPKPE